MAQSLLGVFEPPVRWADYEDMGGVQCEATLGDSFEIHFPAFPERSNKSVDRAAAKPAPRHCASVPLEESPLLTFVRRDQAKAASAMAETAS